MTASLRRFKLSVRVRALYSAVCLSKNITHSSIESTAASLHNQRYEHFFHLAQLSASNNLFVDEYPFRKCAIHENRHSGDCLYANKQEII